jgi:hypothetical protein
VEKMKAVAIIGVSLLVLAIGAGVVALVKAPHEQ